MTKNWFILFILLTGIIYSLPCIAKPQQKKNQPKIECWYTEIPSVIQVDNCGTPICEAKMNCRIYGILYSNLSPRCSAKKGTMTEGPHGSVTYSCPSVTECSEIIKSFSLQNPNEDRPKIRVSLSNNYYLDSGKVKVKAMSTHNNSPSGGSIIATPPPSKRKEPEDTGSTQ